MDREFIRQEVRAELRRENRARLIRGCAINLLMFSIFIVAPAYYLASIVAKTGLVEVPVLTDWQYHPAIYSRHVEPLVGSNTEQIMKSVAARAAFEPASSSISLSMSEEQLTTLAMAGLREAASALPVKISSIQAAILPGSIEVYVVIPRPERFVTATVRFAPAMVEGKVDLQVQQVLVGSYELPKSLVDMFTPTLSKSINDLLAQSVGGAGEISDIILQDGRMTIKVHTKGL